MALSAAAPGSHPDVAVPDLLHATPMVRVDLEATRLGLNLAFASGVSGGFFAEALDRARMGPSTWQPEAFAADLFLSHFVGACFKIRAAAKQPLASATGRSRGSADPLRPGDDFRRTSNL